MKILSHGNASRLVSRLKEWVSAGYLKLTGGTVKGRLTVEGNVMVPRHRIEGNKVVIGKNPSDGSGGLYTYTADGTLIRLLKYSTHNVLEIFPYEVGTPSGAEAHVERPVHFSYVTHFNEKAYFKWGFNVFSDTHFYTNPVIKQLDYPDNPDIKGSHSLVFEYDGYEYNTMRYNEDGILQIGEEAAKEAGTDTRTYGRVVEMRSVSGDQTTERQNNVVSIGPTEYSLKFKNETNTNGAWAGDVSVAYRLTREDQDNDDGSQEGFVARLFERGDGTASYEFYETAGFNLWDVVRSDTWHDVWLGYRDQIYVYTPDGDSEMPPRVDVNCDLHLTSGLPARFKESSSRYMSVQKILTALSTYLDTRLPRYETCGWTFAEFMERALTAYNTGGREALETLTADIAYTAQCYDKWDPTRTYQTGKYQNDKKLVYAPAVDMSRTVSMGSLYANCTALREIPPVTAHRCTNASWMASGCTSLVKVGRIELAMTGIADNDLWQQTYRMFEGDTKLEEYMGGLDHVLSTNAMFKDCTGLRRLDLRGLGNLKLMGLGFNGAKNLRVDGLDELYLDSVNQGSIISSGQYRTNAPLFDDNDPDDPHILNLTTGPGWKAGDLSLLVYGTTVRECNIDVANNHDLSCYGTFGGCTELEKVNFLDFLNTGFEMLDGTFLVGTSKLKFLLIKNIGAVETSGGKTAVSYPFSGASNWGTGSDENRQSLIDTLLTYSKDRVAAGYTVPCTINLSATTKGLLTQEEIAAITAKGYTIA